MDDLFWWRVDVAAFFCLAHAFFIVLSVRESPKVDFPTHQLAQNFKDSQSLKVMPYQEKKISIMKESSFEKEIKASV